MCRPGAQPDRRGLVTLPVALPIPWRVLAAIALVVATAIAGWRVTRWHDAYEALPGLQSALEREEACEDGSKCYARQRALQEAAGHATVVAVESYEAELAALRARNVPAGPVRLCRERDPGRVPGGPTSGPADGAPAGRDVPLEAGRDIAVELYRLADDADREALKLRHLQQWNAALTASPSEP